MMKKCYSIHFTATAQNQFFLRCNILISGKTFLFIEDFTDDQIKLQRYPKDILGTLKYKLPKKNQNISKYLTLILQYTMLQIHIAPNIPNPFFWSIRTHWFTISHVLESEKRDFGFQSNTDS